MNAVHTIRRVGPASASVRSETVGNHSNSARSLLSAQSSSSEMTRAQYLQNRKRVGELVGNVFYGTLIKQMQASKLKGTVMHGGRGEEVFGGQLGLELAKRMGRVTRLEDGKLQ